MSSKYQREIEEILRNMDPDTPKGVGERMRNFQRPRPRRQGPSLSLTGLSLGLLLVSILLVVAASGLAFYDNSTTVISGALGIAAFVVFLLAMVAGWRDRFRGSSAPLTLGRRPQARPSPFTRYDDGIVNADPTAPRPLRRNFLDGLRTRLRLMRLRNEYRQRHDREG